MVALEQLKLSESACTYRRNARVSVFLFLRIWWGHPLHMGYPRAQLKARVKSMIVQTFYVVHQSFHPGTLEIQHNLS